MGINFDKYYKMLGEEKITYKKGALPICVKFYFENKQFSGNEILDLGSGNGFWCNYLTKKGFNVTTCDINGDVDLKEDMHQMNIMDNEFDGVFCNGVFEHSLAPFVLLLECYRILRPNGELFINFPTEDNIEMMKLPQHINIMPYIVFEKIISLIGFKIKFRYKINEPEAGWHYNYLLKK